MQISILQAPTWPEVSLRVYVCTVLRGSTTQKAVPPTAEAIPLPPWRRETHMPGEQPMGHGYQIHGTEGCRAIVDWHRPQRRSKHAEVAGIGNGRLLSWRKSREVAESEVGWPLFCLVG